MRVLYHNWKLPSWKEVPFEGGRGTSGKGEKDHQADIECYSLHDMGKIGLETQTSH